MKQFIRDYLTFNKRERNGVFILLIIITLLIVYLNISEAFVESPNVEFSKFENEIVAFNAAAEIESDSLNQDTVNYSNPDNRLIKTEIHAAPQYFNFNPNNLSPEDWQRLGLRDKQINTIKNYESKGGRFRTKEDVKKMYCISAKEYAQLEPYIQIPVEEKVVKEFDKNKHETQNQRLPPSIVELNSADSAYLTKVKGIGPFYAKSIIKYRVSLGGFAFKEQLMEIWKFDQEKFDAVKDFVIVDDTEIKRININTCTAQELKPRLCIRKNIRSRLFRDCIKKGI